MIRSLAGYEIKRLVEQWGDESLFLAHQASMRRDVLLAVVDASANPGHAEVFLERIRRSASLDHPCVVRIHEAGKEGGLAFCSMEYPADTTLERLLKERGRLPPEDIVSIASDVLDALQYAFTQGLVHGALRPQVVFLPGEKVKVAGFGSSLPSKIMLLGDTAQFLSPEHVSGGAVDTRSDIYSLGMILYRAASGRLPFSDIDPRAVMRRQVEDSPAPLEQAAPPELAPLSGVISRAIEKDPRLRYQSPAEMKDALDKTLHTTAHPARTRPPRRTRKTRRPRR